LHRLYSLGSTARKWDCELRVVRKLKIEYLQHLPRQPDDLPEDVVEVYIHVAMGRIDMCIARRGFIASNQAVQAIQHRFKHLLASVALNHRPVAERIGLAPALSADWCQFLENLLQQNDSWTFLVRAPVPSIAC
jgi:hypothetical protein